MDVKTHRALVLRMNPFVDELLELIEYRKEFVEAEFHGRVAVVVRKIYQAGLEDRTRKQAAIESDGA